MPLIEKQLWFENGPGMFGYQLFWLWEPERGIPSGPCQSICTA